MEEELQQIKELNFTIFTIKEEIYKQKENLRKTKKILKIKQREVKQSLGLSKLSTLIDDSFYLDKYLIVLAVGLFTIVLSIVMLCITENILFFILLAIGFVLLMIGVNTYD